MTRDLRGDVVLVDALRSGDAVAYARLWARHERALRRLALLLSADSAAAQRLLDETGYRVHAAIERAGAPAEPLRASLLGALRRVADDIARAARVPVRFIDDDDGWLPLELPDLRAHGAAGRAWSSLPVLTRTLVWHSIIERESPVQFAPVVGLPVDEVSHRLTLARQQLRMAFAEQHVAAPGDPVCRSVRVGLSVGGRSKVPRRERGHLDVCGACQAAASEIGGIETTLRARIGPALLGDGAVAGQYLGTVRASRRRRNRR